jgi:hypothetical protein
MRLDLTDEETFALLNLLIDRPGPGPTARTAAAALGTGIRL